MLNLFYFLARLAEGHESLWDGVASISLSSISKTSKLISTKFDSISRECGFRCVQTKWGEMGNIDKSLKMIFSWTTTSNALIFGMEHP